MTDIYSEEYIEEMWEIDLKFLLALSSLFN